MSSNNTAAEQLQQAIFRLREQACKFDILEEVCKYGWPLDAPKFAKLATIMGRLGQLWLDVPLPQRLGWIGYSSSNLSFLRAETTAVLQQWCDSHLGQKAGQPDNGRREEWNKKERLVTEEPECEILRNEKTHDRDRLGITTCMGRIVVDCGGLEAASLKECLAATPASHIDLRT